MCHLITVTQFKIEINQFTPPEVQGRMSQNEQEKEYALSHAAESYLSCVQYTQVRMYMQRLDTFPFTADKMW